MIARGLKQCTIYTKKHPQVTQISRAGIAVPIELVENELAGQEVKTDVGARQTREMERYAEQAVDVWHRL